MSVWRIRWFEPSEGIVGEVILWDDHCYYYIREMTPGEKYGVMLPSSARDKDESDGEGCGEVNV